MYEPQWLFLLQDLPVLLQRIFSDHQLKVRQEAETNLQARQLNVANASNFGNFTVRIAEILQCLHCHSKSR